MLYSSWMRIVAIAPILEIFVVSSWGASVTLAWDATPGDNIAGYRLYSGVSSGSYTNVIDVGNVTTGSIDGLIPGTRYYFAVTDYTATGLESNFSGEISYTPPLSTPPWLQISPSSTKQVLLRGTGTPGYTYDVLASGDLLSWSKIGNVTADQTGSFQFTDLQTASSDARYYLLKGSP